MNTSDSERAMKLKRALETAKELEKIGEATVPLLKSALTHRSAGSARNFSSAIPSPRTARSSAVRHTQPMVHYSTLKHHHDHHQPRGHFYWRNSGDISNGV